MIIGEKFCLKLEAYFQNWVAVSDVKKTLHAQVRNAAVEYGGHILEYQSVHRFLLWKLLPPITSPSGSLGSHVIP